MGGLLLSVAMVSTSYIQPWHGEIGHLVQHWNLFGHLMVNMLLEKVRQRSKSSVKVFRFVCPIVDITLNPWFMFLRDTERDQIDHS